MGLLNRIVEKFKEDKDLLSVVSSQQTSSKLRDEKTMFRKNPFGFRAVNKRSGDPWDKYLKVKKPNGEIWTEAMEKLDDINLKQKGMDVTFYSLLHGTAFLALGWRERKGAEKTAEDPVDWENVTDLDYVNVITREELERPTDSAYDLDENGQLQHINLHLDETKIHADRFIPLKAYEADKSPDGVSLLEPMETSLKVLDNVIYGAGQSYYYTGTGFPILKMKNIPEKKRDKIKDKFLNNIQDQPGMALDPSKLEFEFKGAGGEALDPRKYMEPMFTVLGGALGGSKQVFFGAESGEVSGSRTNIEEYFGDLSTYQTRRLTPFVEELIDRMIDGGVLEEQDYNIEWNDMFQKSEEKKAQIYKDKARAFAQYKRAGLTNREAAKLSGIDVGVLENPDMMGMMDTSGMTPGEPDPEERDNEDLEPEI
mgnify:CR=1 FL=1